MMTPSSTPLVAAVEMGYGHVRAARSLATALGEPIVYADRAPLAGEAERRLWQRVRHAYEVTSRLSQLPVVGTPLRWVLDEATAIPHLHPFRDLSAPTRAVHALHRLVERDLGRGLVAELRRTGRPLLTTFYSPAILADCGGIADVWCVVTDADVNRIWAPLDAQRTRIRYLVPTPRAARRLAEYGVPRARITCTGFPLPDALVGGLGMTALRRNLAGRIVRLDPTHAFRDEHREELAHFLGPLPTGDEGQPPLLTFAVGGAGAQAHLARQFLPSVRGLVEAGRLRVALVAGTKLSVKAVFEEAIVRAGLTGLGGRDTAVEVLFSSDLETYLARMDALLARTDVLWTKPSEMTFYGALGLPLVLGAPVGVHERINRRWARESGAGLKQRDPRFAGEWLADFLEDGGLAAAAWAGYTRLPKFGLYRILELLGWPATSSRSDAPVRR